MFNKEEKEFYFNPYILIHNKKYMEFEDAFIGLMAQWVTICKDIYLNPYKLIHNNKLIQKRGYNELDYQFPHFLYSESEHEHFFNKNNITNEDLVIYTDGSYVYENYDKNNIFEYGGIRIWLVHDHKQYYLSQSYTVNNML